MIIVEDEKLNGAGEKIKHGFFGKQGGVSTGIYESLNCGPGSDDTPEAVQANRDIIANKMGVEPDKLISVWQIHSPDCLYISGPVGSGDARPKADAMVTDIPGLALGILTADCGPILFAGEKEDGSPVIGAAHSGWGGALKGVSESTIDKMVEIGAQLETIRVAIGPCIGPASYEVSEGFEAPFLEREPEDEHFFKSARKEGHLMFDLPGYIANRISQTGVTQVTITGVDTYSEEERFFSYRRKTHNNEPDYGRQMSVITIQA